MRWRFWRRARPEPADESAQLAVVESARKLAEAHGRTGEVERVVRELRRIREQNNFAALVRSALREHR